MYTLGLLYTRTFQTTHSIRDVLAAGGRLKNVQYNNYRGAIAIYFNSVAGLHDEKSATAS